MSARDDIAAAMNATNLVNVTSNYRQSLAAFDGFVRFQQLQPADNGFGYMTTWQVWLALPQDVKAAETWLETNMSALLDAFNVECVPTSVTPAELLLGTNNVNGVIFEGARPAE